MIQVLFDIDMPKSCEECPFMVHCDSCESWENRCPILGKKIGYDYNEPYTPKDHRREDCPLKEVQTVERPHGVWEEVCDCDGNHYGWECSVCGRLEKFAKCFCNCGADMRKEGDEK